MEPGSAENLISLLDLLFCLRRIGKTCLVFHPQEYLMEVQKILIYPEAPYYTNNFLAKLFENLAGTKFRLAVTVGVIPNWKDGNL